MAIERTFTGKNTAFVPPSSNRVSESLSNMNDLILKADEMRLNQFKENEDFFLKTTAIDPVTYISSANTATQAKLLDEYNSKATEIVKSRGGLDKLSTEDKLTLLKGRQFIESEQARMNGDLEKYQLAKETIAKNPDKYDADEFRQIMDASYLKDGRYPDIELPIKAQPLELALNKNKVVGTETLDYGEPFDFNGVKVKQGTYYSGTPDEAKGYVKSLVLSNPAYQKDIFNKFSALSDAEKLKWLDLDKSGTVDANEQAYATSAQGENNPILEWAAETYWKQARTSKEGGMTAKPKVSTSGGSSGSMRTFSYGTGNPTKYTPAEAVKTTLGTTTYNKYHPFGQFETYEIPATNIEIQNSNGNTVKPALTNLTVKPTGYDEERDEFTFTVMKDYRNINSSSPRGSGEQIAIKRSQLPNEFGNLDIMVNGKIVKIRDISGSGTSTPTASSSEPRKLKFNAATGKIE